MHRGSHQYGTPVEATYERRGYNHNKEEVEVVQQFREFKPYLKKRLDYIKQSGRNVELREEVEEITYFLDVMQDVFADESHGVDQIKAFIDKIHELIRKNPLTDFQNIKRHSLDAGGELGVNDHPRSPSPGAMGVDTSSTNIPVIPVHGAHRTVEVNFSAQHNHPKPVNKNDSDYHDWGPKPKTTSFSDWGKHRDSGITNREHFKDIDMRQNYFGGSNSNGRGQRRTSVENDYFSARGRGIGRGCPPNRSEDYRYDQDSRSFRNQGFESDTYGNHWQEKSEDYDGHSDWMGPGPSNGNAFTWNIKTENRDSGFGPNFVRRPPREPERDEWGVSRSRPEERPFSSMFERRPSAEMRRAETPMDTLNKFIERRPRSYEQQNHPESAKPPDYNMGHGDFRRERENEDRHMRARVEANSPYPHHGPPQPLISGMPPQAPPSMGYGAQPPMHYPNVSRIPPPQFGAHPPHMPPTPVGMNVGIPNASPPLAKNIPPLLGFQQPMNSFSRPEIHARQPGFNVSQPPPQPPLHHVGPPPPEHYHGGSPSYTGSGSMEASADRVREISLMKAKQCFGNRRPTSQSVSLGPAPVSPGPASPGSGEQASNRIALDPRLNRVPRAGSSQAPQNRQQSPPAATKLPATTPRTDAGNVLRATGDPRARSRLDEDKRKLQDTRDRLKQCEVAKTSKISKIQELRKQFEKEGLHRLGRPVKKKSVSFEDAIGGTNEEGGPSNKSTDKHKSSSHPSKDKESDGVRPARSQNDKTERERSPKKGPEKSKEHKEKSTESDKNKHKDPKHGKKISKKLGKGDKPDKKSGARKNHINIISRMPDTIKDTSSAQPYLSTFKIPRKPKPPQPEIVPLPTENSTAKSRPNDEEAASPPEISLSPPASPEPALSQVPDVETRPDDTEQVSTSSKSKSVPGTSANSSSDINPAAFNFFKQFLMSSVDGDDQQAILSDPNALKQMFFQIQSQLSGAKGKREDESGSSQNPPVASDSDKQQPDSEESAQESAQERGRSRGKKRNTKRRSSLEKLHDALKEMRFDTMLPLGPRRCTRVGEKGDDVPADNSESPEKNTTTEMDQTKSAPLTEKQEEEPAKQPPVKKRGRPPKDSLKGKKPVPKPPAAVATDEESEAVVPEEILEENMPVAARRGRKRKLKPTKVSPRKRTKKAGPVTRAQAALKKSKDVSKKKKKKDEGEKKAKKKTTGMILRRLNRKRIGKNDTNVQNGMCKIKIDPNVLPAVKPEPEERDGFLNSSLLADTADQSYLADQLDSIINENLDNAIVANMDGHTEDNMDLDVFNTLDPDEQGNDMGVKDWNDITIEEEVSSELSYQSLLDGTVSPTKLGTSSAQPVAKIDAPANEPTEKQGLGEKEVVSSSTLPSEKPADDSTGTGSKQITSATSEPLVEHSPIHSSTPVPPEVPEPLITPGNQSQLLPVVLPLNLESLTSTPTTASSESAAKNVKTEVPTDNANGNNDVTNVINEMASSIDFSAPISEPMDAADASVEYKVPVADLVPLPVNIKEEPLELDELLRKDVFKCDQCSYSGKKIISHYVNKHPGSNIPQARLMPETFNGLIELNTSQSKQLLEIILDENHPQVWPCLYCDDRCDCIVDFFDHLTSHTGEFRYECSECKASYPYQKSLVNHVKQHKGVSRNCIRLVYDSAVEKSSRELSGFLCNDCYYFQLRFDSIMRHIEQTNHSTFDVKSVRLIRPGPAKVTAPVPQSAPTVDVLMTLTQVPENVLPAQDSPNPVKLKEKDITADPVAVEETPDPGVNSGVFFSSNLNLAPLAISLDESSLTIPRVFDEPFLDSLMKRVVDEKELAPVLSHSMETDGGKRKRRESDSDTNEENNPPKQIKESETARRIPAPLKEILTKDLSSESHEGEDKPRKGPNLKTTYRKCVDPPHWKQRKKCVVEPNNFFASSEESSDDSQWSDIGSEDEADLETTDVKLKATKSEPESDATKSEFDQGMRNNEELIISREYVEDELDSEYLKKRKYIAMRRPGDLCAVNTILFGYVMPVSSTQCVRLRDAKELEKISTVVGKRFIPFKCRDHMQEMVSLPKLMHLFKCMATYCAYTSESPPDFLNHLMSKHMKGFREPQIDVPCARFIPYDDIKMHKDAECCSYCAARFKDPRDLVEHIVNQHGQSAFQCSKCFYRSYYHRYIVKHFEMVHPNDMLHVLKCPKKVEILSNEATLFQIFVYKCDIDNPLCDKKKRFVFREDFLEHINQCVPPQDLYPCHLCKDRVPMNCIIEHYKSHNLFRFHCSYCQFGSEVKTDLDDHFVVVHPNTSGRVFYRVKPVQKLSDSTRSSREGSPTDNKVVALSVQDAVNSKYYKYAGHDIENCPKTPQAPPPEPLVSDPGGFDTSENEDNEKGRVTNLIGHELYRCVTGDCTFSADNSDSFKEHVGTCEAVADSRSLSCAHCERKMKTVTNLLEHLKVHGEKKQVCSLCSFRCWTSTEITKHIKAVHKVLNYKFIKQDIPESSDPDICVHPKDVATRLITAEEFESKYHSFTRKAVYSLSNIDKLPQCKVFSSNLHCAICPYSTKVRSNIIRHLQIHEKAQADGTTVVPQAPRINPVPYLSRESLEFDKMMNLAASSHKTNGGLATEADVRKLPQFVKEQFRYVCSVCDHITSDDTLLQTHIKVIHSEATSYHCPHCQRNPDSHNNPENIIALEKIPHHLRLHGPKLFKCGHCDVIHHQLRLMEKHIPDKHPEKKPIHYLIRDVDPEGIPSPRTSTSIMSRRQSADDPKSILTEKWKCFLCSSKTSFSSWEDAQQHIETNHKVNNQFKCLACKFSTDEVTGMLKHSQTKCKSKESPKIAIMFSKCDTYDAEDSSVVVPVWKRNGGAVRHIHGNFTEDSVALIRQYNSQLSSGVSDQPPTLVPVSPTKGVSLPPVLPKSPMKTTNSTSKPRRSVSSPSKMAPTKILSPLPTLLAPPPIYIPPTAATSFAPLPPPPPPVPTTPPKQEVFKYHCHKCDMYKTKNPGELRIHLCNEFRYKRWKCLTCHTTFTTEKSLKGHIERDHQKVYHVDLYELQPANPDIEREIDDSIEQQSRKKELINSFAIEKYGKLSCRHCNEDGLTYSTFESHILSQHNG